MDTELFRALNDSLTVPMAELETYCPKEDLDSLEYVYQHRADTGLRRLQPNLAIVYFRAISRINSFTRYSLNGHLTSLLVIWLT